LQFGGARKFFNQIIVVITAAVVGVSQTEHHLRYRKSIYRLKIWTLWWV